MASVMSHNGMVTEVTKDSTAVVEVLRDHACTGCQEHGACTMQSSGNIRVRFKNAHDLKKGDMVRIDIQKRDFFKSMMIVYILPLFLMLVCAVVSDSLGAHQAVTACVTLLSVFVYFLGLKFLHKGRDRQTYTKISN
ncbi:MAG: SoxR reducing system RseC family protein [Deferribacterales bacterium]